MPEALRLRAVSIGPIAARTLRDGAHGTVGAVFERSLYVTLDSIWACLGPPDLGNGPLNVLCEGWPAGVPVSAMMQVDDPVVIVGDAMRIGSTTTIALQDVVPWFPGRPTASRDEELRPGMAAFLAMLPDALPDEGLALLLRAQQSGSPPVAAAAWPAAHYLQELVRQRQCDDSIDADRLSPLLGLGPGLTPSGDDFLGGALVALSLIGMRPLRDAVWRAVRPLVHTHTTAISAAHLAAAAEGFCSAALHDLLDAIASNNAQALPARLAAVGAIGHTSGWDALAGAVTVLATATGAGSSAQRT